MPRKKPAEIEILPPEDDQQPRGRKKLVEAKHTIQYSAPVPVTVEEDPEEENTEEDFEIIEEEKARRRRKTAKDERDDLRRELDKLGVASVSRLKLSIDKYRHSDSDESGTLAEKDYCTKYPVTKDHIVQEEYMDIARRYGAGRYWFTLRMDNKIVRQWERQVNAPLTPSGPVIQHVNPNDPNSPQVIYQQTTNGDGQQQQVPMSIKDIMKTQREALKEQLEMAKLMREAYGFAPEPQQQQQQTTDPELAALHLIAKNPDVMEKLATGMAKTIFGAKGGGDDTPWWADIIKDSITTGQLAPTVQGIVKALFPNGLFGGLSNMFSGGQQNGQTPMAQTPLQTNRSVDNQQPTDGRTVVAEEIPQGNQNLQPANGEANQQGGMLPQNMTPEEQALQSLIEHCRRNIPAPVACDRLIAFADAINDQAPHLSIDRYISMFAQMPIDAALEFVKTQPNGEQVVGLSHAKAWTEELQRLIKEAGQEVEE
jgi:hypothetical protein